MSDFYSHIRPSHSRILSSHSQQKLNSWFIKNFPTIQTQQKLAYLWTSFSNSYFFVIVYFQLYSTRFYYSVKLTLIVFIVTYNWVCFHGKIILVLSTVYFQLYWHSFFVHYQYEFAIKLVVWFIWESIMLQKDPQFISKVLFYHEYI